MAEPPQAPDIEHPAGTKRKLSNVLDIAADLERRLPSIRTDTVAAAALVDTLRRWITRKQPEHSNDDDAAHKASVTLWNLVLQSERETEKASSSVPTEYKLLLLHSRVFAFVIMHNSTCPEMTCSSLEEEPAKGSQVLHLMGIALRAARACIDNNDTELGHVVLEHVEAYRKAIAKLFSGPSDEYTPRQVATFDQLRNSYIALQLTQLSRENRLSDADSLYSEAEANSSSDTFDQAALEELSGCLFRIGNSLLSKKDFPAALVWLERANECLPKTDHTNMSPEMRDIRILTIHSLALASLGLQTPAGNQRAQELAQTLQSDDTGEYSRRVQLIRLELYASPLSQSFDADGYANVILQIVGTFAFSAPEFQLLHHHIQKLHSKSPGLGCKVLDDFLLALRHRDDATEWIEKLVITRVWLLAHQRETPEEIDAVQSVLSKLRIPIGSETASAAQTLIWKRIEQGYQERNYPAAIRWCRLALCHVFEAGGRANRPLIERKLLLCCIENGDVETAKEIYVNMPEPTRDEPMTKYLSYQLAIKANDLEMATECLRGINMSADKMKMLHACILHARHEKAPRFMVQAMKRLADAINHHPSSQIHAPALFRCAILMLRDMLDKEKEPAPSARDMPSESRQAVKDLGDIFGGVVDAIITDRVRHTEAKDHQFTIDELEWFCRAAYNLGLKYSSSWDLRHTISVLESCVKIANLFPMENEVHTTTDVSSKRLTCRFLIASALAALVRRPYTSEREDQMLKDCHAMREHIRAFHTEIKRLGKLNSKSQPSDMVNKLSVLLVFDFEGAIHLGDWDELEAICEIAATCHDSNTLRVLGDSLLRSQALVPSKRDPLLTPASSDKEFVATMRLLVSKLLAVGSFGGDKLIKYYRCLFQAALYRDNDAAFQVLEEVNRMIDDGLNSEAPLNWPEEELQLLAAVAFNEGIDWFAGGREDQARQWVLSAAELAGQCHDGGKLKSLIGSRFGMLNIGDLEIKQSTESDPQETTACGLTDVVDRVV